MSYCCAIYIIMHGFGKYFIFEGSTERKNLLLLKKQIPSNAVECVLGWFGLVTIMTGVISFGAQVGDLFFQK